MVDYKFYSICFLFLLCYHLEIHKEIRTFSFSVEFLGTLWLLYTSNFSIYFPRTVAFITNNTHIPCLEHLQANKKKYIMIDALTALTNLGHVKKNNALLQWEGISAQEAVSWRRVMKPHHMNPPLDSIPQVCYNPKETIACVKVCVPCQRMQLPARPGLKWSMLCTQELTPEACLWNRLNTFLQSG